jgi:hypothetical protein
LGAAGGAGIAAELIESSLNIEALAGGGMRGFAVPFGSFPVNGCDKHNTGNFMPSTFFSDPGENEPIGMKYHTY